MDRGADRLQPFEKAEVSGSLAKFSNNLGNSVTVDLDHSDFA
jgi:hypothetical protein